MKKSIAIFVSFCLLSSLLIAGISTVQAAVAPGITDELVAPGQFIGASSGAVEIFGFGATASAGEVISWVNVTFSGTGFDTTDLAALNVDSSVSGVGLYNDDGTTPDVFDAGDTPVNPLLDNVWVTIGGNYCNMTTTEALPVAATGNYEWFVVIKTSAAISDADQIATTIEANNIGFISAPTATQPGVAEVAETLTADTVVTAVEAGSQENRNALFNSVTGRATIASASDGTGSGIAAYQWEYSGPGTLTISAPTALDTDLSTVTDGMYTIWLNVTDNIGNVGTDNFILRWDTQAPAVEAGSPEVRNALFISTAGRATPASANDPFPASGISTYQWEASGPGSAGFSASTALATNINPDTDGAYTIWLNVTDFAGNVGTDSFTLTWDTVAPIAGAGSNEQRNALFNSLVGRVTPSNEADSPPSSGIATRQWEASGPGIVTFSASTALDTDISANTDGVYFVWYNITDNAGNTDDDVLTLLWDTVIPVVEAGSNELRNALFNSVAGRVTIASISDPAPTSGIATRQWEASGPGIVTFVAPTALDTDISANTDGAYTIWINVTDMAGNVGGDSFTLDWDTVNPTATPTPADGVTDVAIDIGTYTITFNKPMQAVGTLATDTIPTGAWGWTDSTHYEKTGIAALAEATTYDVVLNPDFLDLADNPVTGDVTWDFTTGDFTLPVVYNLTWAPDADVSYNNPIQIDAKINETNLAQAGVMLFTSIGGNATLNNYTEILSYNNGSGNMVNLTPDLSNPDEFNLSMEWDATCPAIVNVSIGGYFSNGTNSEYINSDYWANETGVRYIGVSVYFTNETYPDGVKAELQFLANGSPFGLWINETGQEEWLNAIDFGNGTVQLRIETISLSKTTGALVSADAEMPYGSIFDLVDVEFVVDEIVPNGEYWIIAYGDDDSDNLGFNMSATPFAVDNTPPTIELDSPANFSVIINGTDIALTVTDDNLDLVTYSVNGATAVNLIAPYDIDTTGWADGVYSIEVIATDVAKNEATAEYEFTLDSTAPIILLNSPDLYSHIQPGTIIDFEVTDDNLENVTHYTVHDGTPIDLMAPYDLDTTDWVDGTYSFIVRANDTAGNVAIVSFQFTVDGTAPSVVSTLPVDDATGVLLGTTIDITFNETMNNVSVQNAITISPSITNLGYSWNADNNVLTITPPADLPQNTEYTVTVGTGAEDLAGNSLAAAYTTSFTTILDTDGDGTPDETDTDDDDDGYLDVWEIFLGTDPKDATDMPLDTDGDGAPDGDAGNTEPWMDLDDDGDLVMDALDSDPQDPDVGLEELVGFASNFLMMILAIVAILIIVGVLALVMILRRKSSKPKPPTEEAEPPTEEESPIEEDAGPPDTLEASEPTEQSPVE